MSRSTLRDVAALAGVSRATASRVLAGTDRNVAEDLSQRVRAAADTLGYRTNAAARALRTTSTRSVGVVVPSLRNPYFVALVEEISGALARTGRSLLLAESGGDPAVERERIGALLASFTDSLLVVPTSADHSGPALTDAATQVPVVQVDRWAVGASLPFVGTDDEAGVALLLRHLRDSGARRVVYLGAEQESSAGRHRLAAFRRWSGPADGELLLDAFTIDAGREAATRLLAEGDLPDAVLCAADVLALGLLSGLQHAGVEVPGRVRVTGFDDTDLLRLVTPQVTSLVPPVPELVGRALELLGDTRPVRELLTPALVTRESTAAR